jgi:hypothetical protein
MWGMFWVIKVQKFSASCCGQTCVKYGTEPELEIPDSLTSFDIVLVRFGVSDWKRMVPYETGLKEPNWSIPY